MSQYYRRAMAGGSTTVTTLTGDDAVVVPPTAGNIDVLGRSGSKTSGSASVLTVKSPPYSDISASGTSLLNSGEFVTGAYTRTLPATAGLLDGELVEYVCTTAAILTVTANTGQTIRLGGAVSSSAGTCVSSGQGDGLTLRWSVTAVGWFATSSIGVWVLA